MKLALLSLGLLAATSAAYGQRGNRNETEAVSRACSVRECFSEADVRDFEIIDRTHLIVYVGSQRCAFHIELSGSQCDLSFAPELYFRRTNEVPMIALTRPPRGSGIQGNDSQPRAGRSVDDFDLLELQRRERRDLRICANDLSVQVHGGQWTESSSSGATTDRFGNPRTDCRISDVTSITDDQLVEFYVGRGVVPPLPPMGTGEIEIGEQEDADGEQGRRRNDRDDEEAADSRSRSRGAD